MTIVPDFDRSIALPVRPLDQGDRSAAGIGGTDTFWSVKSGLDILGALFLIPVLVVLSIILLVLNPVFNPGPLLYKQSRLGRNFAPFTAYKFRTMTHSTRSRGPNDPLEHDRITPLGGIFRRMGLDELPQAFNVLRGEMSLIGPRPDCLHHAIAFLASVPEYSQRFSVRPGMSGLAQVKLGYVVGTDATRVKARTDIDYILRAGFALDLWIVWRTIVSVALGRGD
jgi:lipopolysaccharide/colanic/teichoic acid biosynthesis glycosyltransferase